MVKKIGLIFQQHRIHMPKGSISGEGGGGNVHKFSIV